MCTIGTGACGIGPSVSATPGFRHTILRSVEPSSQADGSSVSLAAFAPTPVLTQRCQTGFRHQALNRCEQWLPAGQSPLAPASAAQLAPLPACKPTGADCRLALSATARKRLSQPLFLVGGHRFSKDCAGFVMAVLADAGLDLTASLPARERGEGGVSLLYRMARQRGLLHRHKVPQLGDLVFFDNTWDRNSNGRADDLLTHVGIVERVDPDGTVTLVHHVRRGVLRYKMNLFRPDERRDPATGKVLNHHLRLGVASDELRLTGQLYHAFASLLP
jgi:cell wall-associated NlpC family hydrolase